MDRVNHLKLVSPDPARVEEFLTEVVHLPPGWTIGGFRRGDTDDGLQGSSSQPFSWDDVDQLRGTTGGGGIVVGDETSRQFQVLQSDRANIWAIAIGTRDFDGAWNRAKERGLPMSDVRIVDWSPQDRVRAFNVRVGGLNFEVMRVEPKEVGLSQESEKGRTGRPGAEPG
jgi:hypothetical protein